LLVFAVSEVRNRLKVWIAVSDAIGIDAIVSAGVVGVSDAVRVVA
jgi:hypothetical protein